MNKARIARPWRRTGFTLVELLVVITIIGILMGLLIPAVQAAREAARRTQCSTQINNLAKATIQYEMAKKRYPGWIESYGWFRGTTDPSNPDAGSNTYVFHKKVGSWAVALMPYLDAQPTYEIWTQDKYPLIVGTNTYTANAAPNLAIMQCPSSTTLTGSGGRNSYVSNNGMHHLGVGGRAVTALGTQSVLTAFRHSMKPANGVFNNKYPGLTSLPTGESVRADDLKDGLGNTVLFSENLQARPWHLIRVGASDSAGRLASAASPNGEVGNTAAEPRFLQGFVWHWEDDNPNIQSQSGAPPVSAAHRINGSYNGIDIFGLDMTAIPVANIPSLARPSSGHVGGVNMGFADGATRYVLQTIDYRVYQALMTPRGKSSNVPFPEFIPNGDEI